jgi:hypothetical protein
VQNPVDSTITGSNFVRYKKLQRPIVCTSAEALKLQSHSKTGRTKYKEKEMLFFIELLADQRIGYNKRTHYSIFMES